MPMDEHGHVILPKNLATSILVVERRHVWAVLIPNMDEVTRACVFGKLCYPKSGWKPNHKPREDEEAKRAIGQHHLRFLRLHPSRHWTTRFYSEALPWRCYAVDVQANPFQ